MRRRAPLFAGALMIVLTVVADPLTTSPGGAVPSPNGPPGYWLVASDGGVFTFGGVAFHGSMGGRPLNSPVVGMAATPSGNGYWLVAADGGIFAFGDASFHGSMGGRPLDSPVVGMAATPSGNGYWLVAGDGGIFAFGDAAFSGSMGGRPLDSPVVGMATSPSGSGYWLVAGDGGIFSFGNVAFHGSMGGRPLVAPVVSMAASASGNGYRMVAADGGIFAFGDAPFAGSVGGTRLVAPVVGMADTPDGSGYWMAARDGGVFSENAPFRGSMADFQLNAPIVGIAQGPGLPGFFPAGNYAPGSTGYDISWPQCPNSFPPPPYTIAIVGANGGLAFEHNPCLFGEGLWSAGSQREMYMNVNVGSLNGSSYAFGFQDALDAVSYAGSLGVKAAVWWLDVEECGGCWGPSQSQNAQVIQGAIDGLHAEGLTAGVYSTESQWVDITGPSYLPGVPQWVAGAEPLSEAQAWCVPGAFRTPFETVSFDGGPVWMIQWGYGGFDPTPWDVDYAC